MTRIRPRYRGNATSGRRKSSDESGDEPLGRGKHFTAIPGRSGWVTAIGRY